jgi:diguanylate cyclase (GGDEF)-like protein
MNPGRSEDDPTSAQLAFSRVGVRWLGLAAMACASGLLVLSHVQGAPAEMIGLLGGVVAAGAGAALGATRGASRAAGAAFASTFMVAAVAAMFLFGGVQTSSAVPVVAGVALSGVLLGRRGLLLAAGFGVLGALGAAWAVAQGWLVVTLRSDALGLAAGTVVGSIVLVCLAFLVGRRALALTAEQGARTRELLEASGDVDPTTSSLSLRALRRAIDEMLADPIAREVSALLVIDLDQEALLRKGFGPSTRDAVLRSIAERLRALTRPEDCVARTGDEEFAVLLRGVADAARAVGLARRITEQIEPHVEIGGRTLGLQLRVGVVAVAAEHEAADDLLRDGQAALSVAGRMRGTHIGVFESGIVHRAQRALELDAELARALADEALQAWYQPIVSLADGRLEGFEALVRWEQPDGRVIQPGEFLPRAEATGAVVELDRRMLRQACRQLAAWDRSHPQATPWVSVNLAAAQFETTDLVPTVAAAIRESGIEPARLHLELTESALTTDIERTRAVLCELKALGVVLCLDDFGTGWSSLQYVQSYPFDVLKIDRSFIKSIDAAGGQELSATIVFMARQLGLSVVGEGIETRTQFRVLRDLGVQEGQGYHFSRPLPAERAASFLRAGIPEEPSRAWDRSLLEQVLAVSAADPPPDSEGPSLPSADPPARADVPRPSARRR